MNVLTPFGRLHNILIQYGYKRVTTVNHLYHQNANIDGIIFSVRLLLHDPFFEKLPTVFLDEIPNKLPQLLPHVMKYLELCYIDSSSVYIDRYNPENNMKLVLNHVSNLLHEYVKNPELIQNELRRELSWYWQSEIIDCCYLIANKRKELLFSAFRRNTLVDGEKVEIAIGDNDAQINEWIKKRGAKITDYSGIAFFINLPMKITIPESPWPPTTFIEIVEWLSKNGAKQEANQLIDLSTNAIAECQKFVAILILGTIRLGMIIKVKYSSRIKILKEALKRQGKQRPNNDRKLSLIKKTITAEDSLFARIWIDDVTTEHVTSRNITGIKGLGGKKIALIGCGTIGGNAAHMLVQSGAGTAGGCIELYDSGIFQPENLGRHILGVNYIGENKAIAMTDWVEKNHVPGINIRSFPDKASASQLIANTYKYDLIIDATGEHRFSTSLSHHLRRTSHKVPIIYGWVDAFGLAARALIDTGENKHACYYCCSESDIFKPGVEIPDWKPNSCGIGSFMPFSSQASVCAASLIQGLSLDWVNGIYSPRFRHITIDHNRVHHSKSKNIKPKNNCPCCQIIEYE